MTSDYLIEKYMQRDAIDLEFVKSEYEMILFNHPIRVWAGLKSYFGFSNTSAGKKQDKHGFLEAYVMQEPLTTKAFYPWVTMHQHW